MFVDQITEVIHYDLGGPNLRVCVFLENFGTKPVWDDCSWSTETPETDFLAVYLCLDPDLFPFIIHAWRQYVPNMKDSQTSTSSLSSRKRFGRAPNHARWRVDFGWRWDNLSCHKFNYYYKRRGNLYNYVLSIFLGVICLGRVPWKIVIKTGIYWGSYRIHIYVFLTL